MPLAPFVQKTTCPLLNLFVSVYNQFGRSLLWVCIHISIALQILLHSSNYCVYIIRFDKESHPYQFSLSKLFKVLKSFCFLIFYINLEQSCIYLQNLFRHYDRNCAKLMYQFGIFTLFGYGMYLPSSLGSFVNVLQCSTYKLCVHFDRFTPKQLIFL